MESEHKPPADTEIGESQGGGRASKRQNIYRKTSGKRRSTGERRSRGRKAAKSADSEKWESRSGQRVSKKRISC